MLGSIGELVNEGKEEIDLTGPLILSSLTVTEQDKGATSQILIRSGLDERLISKENVGGFHPDFKVDSSDTLFSPSIPHLQNEELSPATDASQLSNERSVPSENDSFKFNINEADQSRNYRGDSSSSSSITNIKSKIPGLAALTLPATPDFHGNSSNDPWLQNGDPLSDNDSSGPGSPVTPPLLMKLPFSTYGRPKTRLHDPPPLTPAVKNQISNCNSSFGRRRTSVNFFVSEEQQGDRLDRSLAGKSPLPVAETNPVPNPILLNVPSNSKISTNGPTTFEEDQDPLDEDSVPTHKKQKKKESKWLIFVQWSSLFLLVTFLICSLKIQSLDKVIFGINLWRWVALTLVIICGGLISGWLVKLLVVLTEKQYLLKKRVLYFVYGLRHSVRNCIWLALILAIWEVIIQGYKDTVVVNIMSKILWCLFTASISWMVKVLAVKVAANSFHRNAYFDRIQESVFNQYLLEKLSGPPTIVGNLDSGAGEAGSSVHTTNIGQGKSRILMSGTKSNQEVSKAGSSVKSSQDLHCLENVMEISELDTSQEWNHGPKDSEQRKNDFKKSSPRSMPRQDKVCIHPLQRFESPNSLQKSTSTTPGHTTVELGNMPILNLPTMQTPGKRRTSIASQVPLIARSPIPIGQDKLQELTSDTVSVWTLKRLMKLIRNTNMTTYSSMLSQEKGDWEISSEVQAKAAAKQIFYNMARPGQKYLMLKDFLYFLPEEEAARAFSLFETTEAGEITKKSLMKWVVGVYKERRALALTLNDRKTVVAKLHKVLNAVLSVTLIIVFFLIFGVETSKLIVFFTSIFIPSVFVFGNTARTTFESLIFLFITHPFDVGDRIVVDGQVMLVEEINVLNTTFLSSSNEKVYYPNSLLSLKAISNYYRSPDQWDGIDFQIHMNTPIEKLGILKERMQRYIESLPQFWYPDFRIVCKDIEECNKMKMAIWMQHHLNFQEGGERFQRRSNMLLYLKQQLEDLGIEYQLPRQEIIVTGIPVRGLPPLC